MKYNKELLIELLDYDILPDDGLEKLLDEWVGSSRWTEHRRLVFKDTHEDRYFSVVYERGLTELQETYPFDDEPELVDVVEVKPKTITKTVYE